MGRFLSSPGIPCTIRPISRTACHMGRRRQSGELDPGKPPGSQLTERSRTERDHRKGNGESWSKSFDSAQSAGGFPREPALRGCERAFLFGRARRAPASNSSNLDFAFSRETLALSPKYFLVKMYPGLVSAQSFHLATHIPLASDQTPVRSG